MWHLFLKAESFNKWFFIALMHTVSVNLCLFRNRNVYIISGLGLSYMRGIKYFAFLKLLILYGMRFLRFYCRFI